jgi:hypothetical protein
MKMQLRLAFQNKIKFIPQEPKVGAAATAVVLDLELFLLLSSLMVVLDIRNCYSKFWLYIWFGNYSIWYLSLLVLVEL